MHRLAMLICLFAPIAPAAAATVCTFGDLTRSIEVVYPEPGQALPCEVLYDKRAEGGTIETLWRAQHEAGYCEEQADAFLGKLSGLGWQCVPDEDAPAASDAAGSSG